MGRAEEKIEELLKVLRGLEAKLEESRSFMGELSAELLAKLDLMENLLLKLIGEGAGAGEEFVEILAKRKAYQEALGEIYHRVVELEKSLRRDVDQSREAVERAKEQIVQMVEGDLASSGQSLLSDRLPQIAAKGPGPSAPQRQGPVESKLAAADEEAEGLEALGLASETSGDSTLHEPSGRSGAEAEDYGVETFDVGGGCPGVRFYRTANAGLVLDGSCLAEALAACLEERKRLLSEIRAARGEVAQGDILKKPTDRLKKIRIALVRLTDALKGGGLESLARMFEAEGAFFEEATISVFNQDSIGEINSALRTKPGDAPYVAIEELLARYKELRRRLGESYWASLARQVGCAPPDEGPREALLDFLPTEDQLESASQPVGTGTSGAPPFEKTASRSAKVQPRSGIEGYEDSLNIEKMFDELKVERSY